MVIFCSFFIIYLQALRRYVQNRILPDPHLRTSPVNEMCSLDELLESTVDRRADVRDVLPEVNGGNCALGDTLRSELELLQRGQY